MPIQLVLFDSPAESSPVDPLLRERGLKAAALEDPAADHPWVIFRLMEAHDVYPPAAVLRVATTTADIVDAKKAGIWAVGITDAYRETGLSATAELSDEERERIREKIRALFLDAGADAVIDAPGELAEAIDALDGLM